MVKKIKGVRFGIYTRIESRPESSDERVTGHVNKAIDGVFAERRVGIQVLREKEEPGNVATGIRSRIEEVGNIQRCGDHHTFHTICI